MSEPEPVFGSVVTGLSAAQLLVLLSFYSGGGDIARPSVPTRVVIHTHAGTHTTPFSLMFKYALCATRVGNKSGVEE